MKSHFLLFTFICLLTMNSKGQVKYEQIYYGYEAGFDIKKLSSNSYLLLCNYEDIEDDSKRKSALIKVDETGNTVWEKVLDLNSWARFMQITSNSDILLYTQNISLFDATGTLKWRIKPSEQYENYVNTYFVKVFENVANEYFTFISKKGDLLTIDYDGKIISNTISKSEYRIEIKDAYRDNENNYWVVGWTIKDVEPQGTQVSGIYLAKLNSSFSIVKENVIDGHQGAVAVNTGILDDIIVLVDSLDRSKVIHINGDLEVTQSNVYLGSTNYLNSNCKIEQTAQDEYLLYGQSVRKANRNKIFQESKSHGNQIIRDNKVFVFIGDVCPDCDEFNVKYYAKFSAELFDELQSGSDNIFGTNIQIKPNPVSSNLFVDVVDNDYTYVILRADGAIIKSGRKEAGSINVAHFENGIYFLKVQAQSKTYVSKFIKVSQ